MTERSSLQRGYFLTVAAFALVVAVLGLLWPQALPQALPFALPPLHARFVGALYAGGALCMLMASRSASALEVRTTLDLTGLWTGTLLVVTALRWDDFDNQHKGLWAWLAAYAVFPLGAAWLRGTEGRLAVPRAGRIGVAWVPRLLRVQGLLLLALAAALFVWPGSAGVAWPWKISPFLAQVYAGPLSALALTSLLLARRRHWAELRFPCAGISALAALALLASALHAPLFDPSRASTVCWFCALALIAGSNARLAALAARRAPDAAAAAAAGRGAPA